MPLAMRDSRMAATHATSWTPPRGPVGLPEWASFLVLAAVFAILVAGVSFVARKLGLRRRLSWFFALGVGMWLWAPVSADNEAGSWLAAAGFLLMPAAVVAEIVLRRRDHRVRSVG